MTTTDTAPQERPQETLPEDAIDPRLLVRERGVAGYWELFKRRVRGGELGALPVIIGLLVIWTVFYLQEPAFLSSRSLVTISQFAAPVGIIALGIVLVLL